MNLVHLVVQRPRMISHMTSSIPPTGLAHVIDVRLFGQFRRLRNDVVQERPVEFG